MSLGASQITTNAYATFEDNNTFYTVTLKLEDVKYIGINYLIKDADIFMITKNADYPQEYVSFGEKFNTDIIENGSIKREKTRPNQIRLNQTDTDLTVSVFKFFLLLF